MCCSPCSPPPCLPLLASRSLPLACWLSLLLPAWALSQATATAWTLSAAAMRSARPLPSSALLKMHVRTLRLNPTAAMRPPYTMQAPRLRLVPHD